VIAVVISGILGFYLSHIYRPKIPHHHHDNHDNEDPPPEIEISTLGQIFGWGCAVLYLGSRIPQVVKNFRRKSTEGLSLLFFLFACLGNITYVLSIVSASLDPRYLLVNLSWLAGSGGTLLLDGLVSYPLSPCAPFPHVPVFLRCIIWDFY
jgi:solute carrier family 66 (lysosomal lysine-arginine transporter), member 1